jgi:hypothetical protein
MRYLTSVLFLILAYSQSANAQVEKLEKKFSRPSLNCRISAKRNINLWLRQHGEGLGIPTSLKRGRIYYSPSEVTFSPLDSLFQQNPYADRREINEILKNIRHTSMYMSASGFLNTRTETPQEICFLLDAHGQLISIEIVEYIGEKATTSCYLPNGKFHDPYAK